MKAVMEHTGRYHLSQDQIAVEREWIAAAKKDICAFEALYKKYYDAIFRFVFRRTDGMSTATEITADVFYKAMTRLHQYEDRGLPFSSWLYRIALNEINEAYRKSAIHRIISIDNDGHLLALTGDPEKTDDRIDKVISVISTLNEEETAYLEMRFFEERAFREIASIMETSEAGAKMKMQRILEKIRRKLGIRKNKQS